MNCCFSYFATRLLDGAEKRFLLPCAEAIFIIAVCLVFTEDIGGVLTLVFDEEGNLLLEVSANEGDLLYDDIGSELKIRQIRKEKAELLQSLELYYKVFFLGEDVEE